MRKMGMFVLMCVLASAVLAGCGSSGAERSVPDGWQEHASGGFSVALPERWKVVDVKEEGIDAVWDLLEGVDTEWARTATAMLSAERMKEMIQFWAMDSEPAGFGYAIAIVMRQDIPFPMSAEDLCVQMPAAYEQLGVDLVDTECGLTINGLDAVRFMVRLPVGALAVKESQYVFVGEDTLWTLTFGVDETKWSEYEPTFATAAESFRITGAVP